MKFQDQQGNWNTPGRRAGAFDALYRRPHHDAQRRSGLVLPPRSAPIHAVIVPIYKTPEEKTAVLEAAKKLAAGIRELPLASGSTTSR